MQRRQQVSEKNFRESWESNLGLPGEKHTCILWSPQPSVTLELQRLTISAKNDRQQLVINVFQVDSIFCFSGRRGNDADRLPQRHRQPHQHDQHERLQEGGWQEGRGPLDLLPVNRGKFLSEIKQLQVERIFVGKSRASLNLWKIFFFGNNWQTRNKGYNFMMVDRWWLQWTRNHVWAGAWVIFSYATRISAPCQFVVWLSKVGLFRKRTHECVSYHFISCIEVMEHLAWSLS